MKLKGEAKGGECDAIAGINFICKVEIEDWFLACDDTSRSMFKVLDFPGE